MYLGQDASGIQVMDQWNSQNRVRRRTIYWHPHCSGLSNDANAFSVIEW
ncbi:BPSL0067 family protein [Paraburkholderia sp. JPY169]|uniref:BPSL0067 family protein n=1 Tax=Paraburkholderia youngii TaxID=2782701 RepID=A0A7Y6K257_9BURK|nr:BPSL0067 family protein [Paraburkholderia youngii]